MVFVGPVKGSQTSETVALDVSIDIFSTSSESNSLFIHRAAHQPSPSGWILPSSEMDFQEPPILNWFSYVDRYLRSRVVVDPRIFKAVAYSSMLAGRREPICSQQGS